MNLKMIITGENSSLWFCCFSSLSVAETHAGDDRSDAGTDEDEIRRVKESKEQKGSTVIPTPPQHTHMYTHTRTPGPPLNPSLPAGVQVSRITSSVSVHFLLPSKHPSISCSGAHHWWFFSSTSCQDSSYNPHLNLADCPNLRVLVCWVGRGET